MPKAIALITVLVALITPASVQARVVLYGSPGAEQTQLQGWIDSAHVRTPNVRVRLYEGNCNEGRPEGSRAEAYEIPGQEASTVQSCASFTDNDAYAVYMPHVAWHPQIEAWWWHLNLLNELGHTYDLLVGERDRHRFVFGHITGEGSRFWWPINPWAAMNREWEKWSMAYAFCGVGFSYTEAHMLIESGEYSGFGYDPDAREYGAECWMMTHLPGRTGKKIRLPGWR